MERSEGGLPKINLMAFILTALLFSAVLLPAIGVDTEKSNLAGCQRNLRLIWNGLESYCADYNGIFPPAMVGRNEGYAQKNMMYFLCPRYVKNPETFHCPADSAFWRSSDYRQSYSYFFEYGSFQARIHEPVDFPFWSGRRKIKDLSKGRLIHDGEPWISRDAQSGWFEDIPADYRRHFESKVENCLYLDGHVSVRNTHWPDDDPWNYWAGNWGWD